MGDRAHTQPPRPYELRERIVELLDSCAPSNSEQLRFEQPVPILYWYEFNSPDLGRSVQLRKGRAPTDVGRWHCPILHEDETDLFAIMDSERVVHAGKIDDAQTINEIVLCSAQIDNARACVAILPESPARRMSLVSFTFDEEKWMVVVPIRKGQHRRFEILVDELSTEQEKTDILKRHCTTINAKGDWTWCGVLNPQ